MKDWCRASEETYVTELERLEEENKSLKELLFPEEIIIRKTKEGFRLQYKAENRGCVTGPQTLDLVFEQILNIWGE